MVEAQPQGILKNAHEDQDAQRRVNFDEEELAAYDA